MNVKIKFYRKNQEKPVLVTEMIDSLEEYNNLIVQLADLKESNSIAVLEFFDDTIVIDFSTIDFIMVSKPSDVQIDFTPVDDNQETNSNIIMTEDAASVSSAMPVHEGKSKTTEPALEKPYEESEQLTESVIEESETDKLFLVDENDSIESNIDIEG